MNFIWSNGIWTEDLHVGLSTAKIGDNFGWVAGARNELSWQMNQHNRSSLLFGILSSTDPASPNRYEFTSLGNEKYAIHYGESFGYLYQELGNTSGLFSYGLKHTLSFPIGQFWLAATFHHNFGFHYSASILHAGFKMPNLFRQDAGLNLDFSLLLPEPGAKRNPGYQVVLKYIHYLY